MAPIDMKIYTVGGAVRDELLGLPVQELNVTRLLGAGLVLVGVLCVSFGHK